jgi:hypothetical protein
MVFRKTLLLFLFSFNVALAQKFDKQLIMVLPDTSTSQLQEADLSLGPGDDYCYYYPGGTTVLTKTKTYGPFMQEGTRYWPYVFYDIRRNSHYIKSVNSGALYGPYSGTISTIEHANFFRGGLGYTVSSPDSISYYINGTWVATVSREDYIDRSGWPDWWYVTNDNGNILYTVKKGKWNYLFLNGKLLDSSLHYYGRLRIDKKNNYYYMLGNFEAGYNYQSRHKFYTFKPLPHKPQKVFYKLEVPNTMPWQAGMYNNMLIYNDYDTVLYYDNETHDVAVTICDKPVGNSEVTVLTKGNTVFSCRLDAMGASNVYPFNYISGSVPTRICINGIGHDLPYEGISLPGIDSFGHYALYGRRDYYLYKNVDGVEEKDALSKHGVRAKPISIDARGNTICYYETDDSVYVYQNNRLFRSCRNQQFEMQMTIAHHVWMNETGQEWLPMFDIDSNSYLVYNNTISPPLLKISGYDLNIGCVISAGINEYGYWLMQKTGNKKYDLIINNRRIALPHGINLEGPLYDDLKRYCNLTANEYIFYLKEGSNIYRYKISL